jgi:hypothetical protein
MQEFCNHTNKTFKKRLYRTTNNKLKKELKEKIIKNKAKEVEEAIKGKTKK